MSTKNPSAPTFAAALSNLGDAAMEGYKIEHAIRLLNLFARANGADAAGLTGKETREMEVSWFTVEYMAARLAEPHKAISARLQKADSLVENLQYLP